MVVVAPSLDHNIISPQYYYYQMHHHCFWEPGLVINSTGHLTSKLSCQKVYRLAFCIFVQICYPFRISLIPTVCFPISAVPSTVSNQYAFSTSWTALLLKYTLSVQRLAYNLTPPTINLYPYLPTLFTSFAFLVNIVPYSCLYTLALLDTYSVNFTPESTHLLFPEFKITLQYIPIYCIFKFYTWIPLADWITPLIPPWFP